MVEQTTPPAPLPDDEAPRVLVVDDNQLIRRTVQRTLENHGMRVVAAGSGEEAFEICVDGHFDLLVTDFTMGAVSGVQLCRLLRSDPDTASIPIILFTAANDPRSRFWARHAGADAYIAKESMRDELVSTVKRLLVERPPHERPTRLSTSKDALERLSVVLEHHLFEAVVASEARRLMDRIHDRLDFSNAVLDLASEIIGCPYIAWNMGGAGGPTEAVIVRGHWPEGRDEENLRVLGLGGEALSIVADSSREGSREGEEVVAGQVARFEVITRGETLATLSLFSGEKGLAETDRETAQLMAEHLGATVKSLFLMEEARLLALTDGLTGLRNRRNLSEQLDAELARARRLKGPFCVALCDVDHFKRVNDEFGHGVGDEVLRRVSRALEASVRKGDSVGRWGGEEFLVLFPNTDLEGSRIVSERLREAVESLVLDDLGDVKVTISIGLAAMSNGDEMVGLLDAADRALYVAKDKGRNQVMTTP